VRNTSGLRAETESYEKSSFVLAASCPLASARNVRGKGRLNRQLLEHRRPGEAGEVPMAKTCKTCNGNGTVDCPRCEEGEIGCKWCECGSCAGVGRDPDKQCRGCEGKGTQGWNQGLIFRRKCRDCKGTGRNDYKCSSCRGRGSHGCSRCEDGVMRCPNCNASGEVSCNACGGTGKRVR